MNKLPFTRPNVLRSIVVIGVLICAAATLRADIVNMVKDINPGAIGSNPYPLVNVNGTRFFTGKDCIQGSELWKSDGAAAGTVLVKDINPGANDSHPYPLVNVNGTLFFAANDGVHGYELWKSDGTAAGTVLVKDINPGTG